jgi:putative redox protein
MGVASMADSMARLKWEGGQRFTGGTPEGPQVLIDGRGEGGPSPMGALLLSLGGCMGIDIVDIASKMRVSIGTLEVELEADRRPEPPRRFTRIVMRFRVTGADVADRVKLERAVELSRETYCSVFHTLSPELEIVTELDIA